MFGYKALAPTAHYLEQSNLSKSTYFIATSKKMATFSSSHFNILMILIL